MIWRYRCVDCGKLNREDELETVQTTYEAYFGVGGIFPNSTPLTLHVCPYCKSEELEIIEKEDTDHDGQS